MTIEKQIQEKSVAPRVTPADIDANIVSVYYFSALEGALYEDERKQKPPAKIADFSPLRLLTFCVLILKNGFTVTGESACVSPENFDAEIGRNIAYANAREKIWPLMGYALRDKLAGKSC